MDRICGNTRLDLNVLLTNLGELYNGVGIALSRYREEEKRAIVNSLSLKLSDFCFTLQSQSTILDLLI